jgi:NADPH:quinone reductase
MTVLLSPVGLFLRPFGHLAVVDVSPTFATSALMLKSASVHLEMVFSRILHASDIHRQGAILDSVASLVVVGRIRSITTIRLPGLSAETMKAAHELLETSRTIGNFVITTR